MKNTYVTINTILSKKKPMYCEKMDISVWTFHYCDTLFWVRFMKKISLIKIHS